MMALMLWVESKNPYCPGTPEKIATIKDALKFLRLYNNFDLSTN